MSTRELHDLLSFCGNDEEVYSRLQNLTEEYSGVNRDINEDDFEDVEDEDTVMKAIEDLDWLSSDVDDEKRVAEFCQNGCGCTLGPNSSSCSGLFTVEKIRETRLCSLEFSREELDLVILACIDSCLVNGDSLHCDERPRPRFEPTFCGKRVCIGTFLFLRGIGKWRLKSLLKHYKQYGITIRGHGNARRLPPNACSIETVKEVAVFIDNFATLHGLVLPGRVPGFSRTDIRLLPSSLCKKSVWSAYKEASEREGKPFVQYSKFVELWNRLIPFVCVCKPMTDLCFTCQQNNSAIQKSANLPDSAKTEAVKLHEQHLLDAKAARDHYREVSKCDANIEMLTRERKDPCSYNGKMHYSFDFAQQIMYPANPLQPGPIFFKTPRKCGLFGICCETFPNQVNYIIDEAVQTGKGANTVISYIHHFLENYGVGETSVHFHADNCSGQNKNNFVLWYFAWRVIVGLHKDIDYSFLLAGHTKFATWTSLLLFTVSILHSPYIAS